MSLGVLLGLLLGVLQAHTVHAVGQELFRSSVNRNPAASGKTECAWTGKKKHWGFFFFFLQRREAGLFVNLPVNFNFVRPGPTWSILVQRY
jgi:hypothetical protein